jgi:hypothetical protein
VFLDASYLPAFLYGATPTIARLREAAARQQADLLFMFSTDCDLHQAYHAFSADEARALCHADSALLDVRTGLVPFVSRAEETITLSEADDEFSIEETIRRAETRGVDAAMRTNAEALVRFLAVPSTTGAPSQSKANELVDRPSVKTD